MDGKEIRFIDLFGGVGGFSLGLKRATESMGYLQQEDAKRSSNTKYSTQRMPTTFNCVAYYELDKYAVQTYNKNFGTNHEPTDITKLQAGDIPPHDLICAGFPCQSFSMAGKRRGFKDTRGTLFFEICRIARDCGTRYLLLENVKGLTTHEGGKTFCTILQSLDELGYDCQWQVLNSKDFGVPQNRERVFIIGNLRGEPRPEIFPLGEGYQDAPERNSHAAPIIRAIHGGGHSGGHHSGMTLLTHPIDANYQKGNNNPMVLTQDRHDWREHQTPNEVPCLKKRMGEGGNNVPMVMAHRVRSKAGLGTCVEFQKGHTNSITSVAKDNYLVADANIRRLTPIECERLQAFPDQWTTGISDSQRYKQMGNAVTVNVIEAIGRAFLGGLT